MTVKAGYMRNYLYPSKLAVYDTPFNRLKYSAIDPSLSSVSAVSDDLITSSPSSPTSGSAAAGEEGVKTTSKDKLTRYMRGRSVIIKRQLDTANKLVKQNSVTPKEVGEKLLKQHKVELEEEQGERIVLEKEVDGGGIYEANIIRDGGEDVSFIIQVVKR